MNNHTELLIAFLSATSKKGHIALVDTAKITAKTAGNLQYDKKIEIKFTVYPGQSPESPELKALMDNAGESLIEH